MYCVKGIGKTHAKWSPVATAFYRLLPSIEIKGEILNEDAVLLKKTCPVGVYDIEDYGDMSDDRGVAKKAYVKNARNCTTCRECIRPKEFKDKILLEKVKDHYECK
jgi:DNA-directed RNA polymerase I and III subunit RPAC1